MEEKNNKKGKLLYTLLGIALLLTLVGGAYAFFSASVSNSGTIGGNTQNINNNSLTLNIKKVVFTGATAPSNDLVPAFFGLDNNDELVVANPSQLGQTQVANMLSDKCENDGFTGCHVYQIKISADQNITHANLLLNLSVGNLTGAADVEDKSQWGYVVFTATGTVDPSTGATAGLTSPVLNTNNGEPAAIGDGVTNLDIHNDGSLSTTTVTYYLLVYVNDTDESQNTSTSGTGDANYVVGTYSGTLELQALGGKVRACFTPSGTCEVEDVETAAQYITSLYTDATKTTATVNNITYNLAPSVGLMNDRHGSMSETTPAYGISYNLVSNTNEEAQASMISTADAGNIRYYGANPNNYVWLGDGIFYEETDETGAVIGTVASWKKLWRIIGVFNGRLKLVQVDEIGDSNNYPFVSWDRGHNQWGPSPADGSGYAGSDLMRLLNPGYENESINNSLYWNKGTGTVYVSDYQTQSNTSYAITGLSAAEKNMIDDVTWYLGAYNDETDADAIAAYVDEIYETERQSTILACSSVNSATNSNICDDNITRTATWFGKVGLMYPSDYGYATDLSLCATELQYYSNDVCKTNNWIYSFHLNTASRYTSQYYYGEWLLTPSVPYYASLKTAGTSIDYDGGTGISGTYNRLAVHPAIYLKSGVTISSGNGSESNPYVLSLS